MPRPAVIFGGPSPEHDVSILTGLQACRVLIDGGHDPEALYWTKGGEWYAVAPDAEPVAFLEGPHAGARRLDLVVDLARGGFHEERTLGRRRRLDVDVVLNCCHGGPGEDGSLQGALDAAGLRYSGPGRDGAAIGMDKLAFGAAVAAAGLPSLPRVVLTPEAPDPDVEPPWIVKPRFGGSSIGIEVTDDPDTARALAGTSVHLRAGAVLESYRSDAADLQVAVRTWPEVQLSAIERPLRKPDGSTYTYAEKYLGGEGMASAPRELPARIPDPVAERIRDAARTVVDVARVRGLARIDFLWDGGEGLWVNEINTIPGSLALPLWVDPPVARLRLVEDLLAEARSSPTARYTSEGADGSALRAAGDIPGKLA